MQSFDQNHRIVESLEPTGNGGIIGENPKPSAQ